MKKRFLAIALATACAATLFVGCGSSKSADTDASNSTDTKDTTATESSTETTEETTDTTTDESTLSDSSDNMTVYDNGVFSFKYNPDYIVVSEYDDPVVTVANFYHEGTEISGTNAINIFTIEDCDAKDYIKGTYGASDDQITEAYFGGGDYTAYCYAPTVEDTSYGVPTYYAIQNGDDMLFIEVDSTVESDEETMYLISDTLSGVLDTLTLD